MKSVFSCSDFLSDLWQSGTDAAEGLGGLACVASEGGSTQVVRDASTDLLNLLEQAEEADSNSRLLSHLAASSSNRQDVPGNQGLARQTESSVLQSGYQAAQPSQTQPFFPQPSATFPMVHAESGHQHQMPSTSTAQGVFHMDPVQQAKAICNHGVSVTALQQQLAELKGKASGLESILRTGMQSSASPCFPDLAGKSDHPTVFPEGAVPSGAVPQGPVAASSASQPQMGLQEYQLRQLASLLGSANMAALQSISMPLGVPQTLPDSNLRSTSQQPASSAKVHDHSSENDDTGAIPELHKLTGLSEGLDGGLEAALLDDGEGEGEQSWEAKLDKSLPPPEMKRMRRMLSNRESARRSRRRKQAHMQDLEVQNNELVEANEKLQKEMAALRSLAKEAILEKKKSQAALETLKHQVVQLLAERNMLPKQIPKQEEQELNPPPPASTGADSNASGSEQWVMAASTTLTHALPSGPAPDSPQEAGIVPNSPKRARLGLDSPQKSGFASDSPHQPRLALDSPHLSGLDPNSIQQSGLVPESPQKPASAPDSPEKPSVKAEQATAVKGSKFPKAPVSPRRKTTETGTKRKASEMC